MKCMNCGLPLSPARNQTNCPRCGTPLNTDQGVPQLPFAQSGGWGNMGGGTPQNNPWAQTGTPTPPPIPFMQQGQQNQMGVGPGRMAGPNGPGFPESPFSPRRPYPPQKTTRKSRNLFMIAGLCVGVGALLLVLIVVLGMNGGNNPSSSANANQASPTSVSNANTPQVTNTAAPTTTSSSATPSSSPTASGTAYPGQQYIDGAQMATGVNNNTMQPQQLTTTFTVGSNMYVIFNLHPPSTGGEVCSLWYISGNTTPVTSYNLDVKSTSRANYIYATYGSAGQAYVELYWASNNTCSDKILAQHIDFTVTAS